MSGTTALVFPDNDVIMGLGEAPFKEELVIKTAANCLPGTLVIRDTTDSQLQTCAAAGHAIGWLGYGEYVGLDKPATIETAYAAKDLAPVHYGGRFAVKALLATSQTIVKGDYLVAGATGMVTKASAATIAASGAANITNNQAILGSYGAEGPVVCQALESVTTTGAAARLWVKSMI